MSESCPSQQTHFVCDISLPQVDHQCNKNTLLALYAKKSCLRVTKMKLISHKKWFLTIFKYEFYKKYTLEGNPLHVPAQTMLLYTRRIVQNPYRGMQMLSSLHSHSSSGCSIDGTMKMPLDKCIHQHICTQISRPSDNVMALLKLYTFTHTLPFQGSLWYSLTYAVTCMLVIQPCKNLNIWCILYIFAQLPIPNMYGVAIRNHF